MKRAGVMFCLLAGALPLFAQSPAESRRRAVEQVADAVRQSIRDWDFSAMTGAVTRAQALVASDDDERFHRALWTGTAAFHAVLYLRSSQDETEAARIEMEKTAIEALNRALSLEPDSSDCHAMLGVLYGMEISRSPLRALSLGTRLRRHRVAAMRAVETNPRVSYLEGITMLNRANGDKEVEQAVDLLVRAESLFARQAGEGAASDAAGWGREHTLLFLGEATEQLGRYKEALTWFRAAERLDPRLERAGKGIERCQKRQQDR
jgi:tetratricopeptide (TPR) repeat protein